MSSLHCSQMSLVSSVREHECNFCKKAFKTKVQLGIHQARHTGTQRVKDSFQFDPDPGLGSVISQKLIRIQLMNVSLSFAGLFDQK